MTMNGISSNKLRIGVPWRFKGFEELVQVHYDVQLNATYFSGFCIDVFKAAINLLPYQVEYEFIPFRVANSSGQTPHKSYNDLIYQVHLQACFVSFLKTKF